MSILYFAVYAKKKQIKLAELHNQESLNIYQNIKSQISDLLNKTNPDTIEYKQYKISYFSKQAIF